MTLLCLRNQDKLRKQEAAHHRKAWFLTPTSRDIMQAVEEAKKRKNPDQENALKLFLQQRAV
jgi:hypothetical protein